MSQIVTTNPRIEMERRVHQIVRDLDQLVRQSGVDIDVRWDPDLMTVEMKALLAVLANIFANCRIEVQQRPGLNGPETGIMFFGPAEAVLMGAEQMRRERPDPARPAGMPPPIRIH